ncbi:MAG: IPT/TIG domain-containing protein [Odoribacteraceae bacterium]|nr:IPT/TIG domain-containing protein [Odoribacteraceae bacterium]
MKNTHATGRRLLAGRLLLVPALILLTACGESNNNANPYDRPHDPNAEIVVTNIGPENGGIGTKVVVTGSNFGNDPAKLKLFFNKKEAFVMKVQDNAIYALVPKQPGDFSTIRVVIDGRESILPDRQFQYFIKSSVTTIAGQQGVATSVDGPALEATMGRPSMLAVNDDGLLFVADDGGMMLRMISLQDNKVTTPITGMNSPWSVTFNRAQDKVFVLERAVAPRPLLFYALSKSSGWMEQETYYDQMDMSGNYIAGRFIYTGLTTDDEYIYSMSQTGSRLIRVHQETKKVELIGENLGLSSWVHFSFNPVDKKLYLAAGSYGRIYRLDPYLTPPGHTTPWVTANDLEHILGQARGTVVEGNGTNAQFGTFSQMATDRDGNVYVGDYQNHVIWKIDTDLNATVVGGTPGVAGYVDGKPSESRLDTPYGLASTSDGILYVGEAVNRLIRCISIQ